MGHRQGEGTPVVSRNFTRSRREVSPAGWPGGKGRAAGELDGV